MKSWGIKDPDAVLDYAIDWGIDATDPYLEDGETIVSSTFTIVEGTVVKESEEFVLTGLATVWLSGGTLGERCTITNHIVTSAGREDDRSARLRIRSR